MEQVASSPATVSPPPSPPPPVPPPPVALCSDTTIPPTPICSVKIDIVLVVDRSDSIRAAGVHDDISEYMRRFVDDFTLANAGIEGPRIGIATFNGLPGGARRAPADAPRMPRPPNRRPDQPHRVA